MLARVAVEQRIHIMHRAHLARPFAHGALETSAAETGGGGGGRVFADVAHVAPQFGSEGQRVRAGA